MRLPSDEENQGLLEDANVPNNANLFSSDNDVGIVGRDKMAAAAVQSLLYIVVIAAVTIISVLIVEIANAFTRDSVPIWVPFLIFWIGHIVVGGTIYQSIRYMLQAMVSKSNRERFSQKWHQANERRIPLIQFTVFNLAWIFGLSFALVIAEVLALLACLNIVPVVCAFIIPYVIVSIAISNSLLCRSMSFGVFFSWFMVLIFLVTLNVRLSSDSLVVSWDWILSSVFVLLGFWWLNCFVVVLKHMIGQVILKQYQVESIALYIVSFTLGMFANVVILTYLNNVSLVGPYSVGVAYIVILLAAFLFFIALSRVVQEQLNLVIVRMGSDRPLLLSRSGNGGWDVDQARGYHVNLLLGEIDFVQSPKYDAETDVEGGIDLFSCGCFPSIEFSVFRSKHVDETED